MSHQGNFITSNGEHCGKPFETKVDVLPQKDKMIICYQDIGTLLVVMILSDACYFH